MEFHTLSNIEKRKSADLLVIPFFKKEKNVEAGATLPASLKKQLAVAIESGDFKGKEGEVLSLYTQNQPEKRAILLGLGSQEKLSLESLRRAYGSLAKNCLGRKLSRLNVLVPEIKIKDLSEDRFITSIVEGLLLPNYEIGRYKQPDSEESENPTLLSSITLISPLKNVQSLAEKTLAVCEAVYYARDLINCNADDVTPQYLEACARGIQQEYPKVKVTFFDKKRLEKEKMGLLLAVNRGSALDPAFFIMEYKGNPKSKDHTILVGKGVTYDTGGLNIKVASPGGMETMKCDMSGAAACIATVMLACQLELKVNVTAVIPATENGVDAKSFKPGDVYTGYSGKTVEMMNSDAEGRLILADALAYAVKNLNPSRIIDLATLTGGIDIALGPEATGLMSNHDILAADLVKAGDVTGERLWRMPLFEEYRDRLKSDIADIKSWNGRTATSCVAATFLKEFVADVPWAHLDIASTAYVTEPKKYQPKYATGMGVRLLLEYLESLQS